MTASPMTASPVTDRFTAIAAAVAARPETFKPIPGYQYYEAGDKGTIRSIDRTVNGRFYRGVTLKDRPSNKGGRNENDPRRYRKINVRNDAGEVDTPLVHSLVLLAHAGPRPRGQEACHKDDDPEHNWYPENLRWDTRAGNEADRRRNNPQPPPPVKPPKDCVRCGAEFTGNGRRCHDCVVWIGHEAARLLISGKTIGKVMDMLDYPSAEGLHTLAVRYGGYGRCWCRRLQNVTTTVRGRRSYCDRP